MDKRLEKALEFSNFLETQNNQKRIFLAQYKENLVYYTHGHKFTVTQDLINFLHTLSEMHLLDAVVLDDNNTPYAVTNIDEFAKEIMGVYVFASRKYASDYESIKKNRSVQGLIDL
mgnify:FL=1|jgi:hypothetical protein|tara:strand:+ start:969 stop:1316 length:348 start_codon:yes stop_codon:yes gene_type:complete